MDSSCCHGAGYPCPGCSHEDDDDDDEGCSHEDGDDDDDDEGWPGCSHGGDDDDEGCEGDDDDDCHAGKVFVWFGWLLAEYSNTGQWDLAYFFCFLLGFA